jgi:hypothetical protein
MISEPATSSDAPGEEDDLESGERRRRIGGALGYREVTAPKVARKHPRFQPLVIGPAGLEPAKTDLSRGSPPI